MRRLALTVLLAALCVGCESKTPVGPGTVTVSKSTSTTTSTTTSTIPPSTTAAFIFSPLTPAALEVVSFNAFGSTAAPGRTIVGYTWDFGDGQSKTGVSVTHDFFPQGLYIVTLTVTDSAGEQASVSKPVGAGVPQPPVTTTTIPTTTSAHYVSTQADPEIPADLTLFFQLLTSVQSPSARTGLAGLGDFKFAPLADSKYSVQGTYSKRNGETGTISGELVGTLSPEPAGKFTGSLTAKNVNGCTATRPFSGAISNASLQWTAPSGWNPPCLPDPLAFSSINLVTSDAPPSIPTTSTTSTSTTSVLCNYSLNPVSATLEAQGTPGSAFQTVTVGITTAAGCGWSMQTSTPWITLVSPTVGTGPATVSFQVANNTDFQRRVGSVVIAGITFLVTQNQASDLLAFIPPPATSYCTRGNGLAFSLGVLNQGNGGAPAFDTTVTFTSTSGSVPDSRAAPGLAAGASTVLSFQVPDVCLTLACSFSIAVDPKNVIAETDENNNSGQGACPGPIVIG